MIEELAATFQNIDDTELSAILAQATSAERASQIHAVLAYRERERRFPTPAAQKPGNYTLIHQETTQDGDSFEIAAIFRAEIAPEHLEEDEPPRRFYEEDATPEQIDENERQEAGAEERRAIHGAAEKAGIHFRAETPPSDYSPTGRRFYSAVTLEKAGRFVILRQHSAIDC